LSDRPLLMYAQALEMLLTADTWGKKRKILEEQQEWLLAPETTDLLNGLIKEVKAQPFINDETKTTQLACLDRYRMLLISAYHTGIRQAWGRFMMDMSSFQS
jgi:hypothetical protein